MVSKSGSQTMVVDEAKLLGFVGKSVGFDLYNPSAGGYSVHPVASIVISSDLFAVSLVSAYCYNGGLNCH
jgi:hypothetical protein